LGITEIPPQSNFELAIGSVASGQQNVGPSQSRFVGIGQVALLMIVFDLGNKILGETGLTGLVESNLSSKPAVSDPSITKTDQFFDVFANRSARPEGGVHLIESSSKLWGIGHDRTNGGRAIGQRRRQSWGCGHQEVSLVGGAESG
jgi:hypothetical protein